MVQEHIATACAQVETWVVGQWGRQSVAILAMILGRLCHIYSVQPGDVSHIVNMTYNSFERPE